MAELQNYAEQGTCPVCGGNNIDYGTLELGECDSVYYKATCEDCGADFEEVYDMKFAGHYGISDGNGKYLGNLT